MTDKKHTPEGWEKDWEEVNKQLSKDGGVNPYAYRLGWLKGREPLAGIDKPAEWVEKMKRIAGYIKLGDNLYGIDIADILEANERLKKEIAEWELFSKATNESIEERNKSIAQLKKTAQRLFNYMSEKHGVTLLETDIQEIERILSEPCSRHECHEHTESPSPMEGKTPLKGWISVEEKLPEENQLVWGWDGKSTVFMWCRVYDKSEGWFQAISYGQPYGENGKIVADCEIEDIDVKYWQPLPELKLEE